MLTFRCRRFHKLVAVYALVLVSMSALAGETQQERSKQLKNAMLRGDISTAKHILTHGPVPARGPEGLCWLQSAITLKESVLLGPLVNAGVPLECEDTGMTPLQFAVSYQRYNSAEKLILLGANVNARKRDGIGLALTPPLDSVVLSYLDNKMLGFDNSQLKSLIRLLLAHGANPNLTDKPPSTTPLALAAEQGATDLAVMLLQASANPNQISGTRKNAIAPLESAVLSGHGNIETIRALLYAGADPRAGPYADKLLEKAQKTMPQAVPLLKQYGAR